MTLTCDTVLAADRKLYTELEEQARQLDDHILQLRRRVSAVREKRNALVCVNRSPDDVLAMTFAFLVQPAGPNCLNYELIDASHVCRRWRAIALSNPTLWTSISIHNVDQVDMFAKRSYPMPLDVYHDLRSGFDDRVLPPLIPRLRTLSLRHCSSRALLALNKAWATCSSPLLEDLTVQNDYEDAVPTYSGLEAPLPALRSLTLGNIFFAPTCPLFQNNLRHLHLMSRRSSELTIGDHFQILGRCPNLETLQLSSFHTNHQPEPEIQLPHPIPLASLTSLELKDCADWIPAALLRNLALPLSTSICIVRIRSSPHGPHPEALPALPIMAGFRQLDVSCWTTSQGVSSLFLSAHRAPHAAHPAFRFEVRHTAAVPRVWLDTLPTVVDTREVETLRLRLEGNPPRRHHDLPRPLALAGFCALTTLSVGGPMSGALHLSLLRDLSADTTGAVAQLACPALEALEFADPHCDVDFWDALMVMVRDRRLLVGGPFKRVSLKAATGIVDSTHPSVHMMRTLLDDFQLSAAEQPSVPGPSGVAAEAWG